MSSVYDEIYKIVQTIPKGKVLTYGIVSHMIGGRMSAQGVGWALKALGSKKRKAESPINDMKTVPWQRVVNTQGGTSTHKIADIPPGFQQHLLELEGIVFDEEGKMELPKYLWTEGLANGSQSDAFRQNKARKTASKSLPKTKSTGDPGYRDPK
ncbi:MAG: MGMT family protein [Candidatus Obscuribacterales bacterium]|nr:MGMT family protein [Candidatus Obscuribacterales bacterium]